MIDNSTFPTFLLRRDKRPIDETDHKTNYSEGRSQKVKLMKSTKYF